MLKTQGLTPEQRLHTVELEDVKSVKSDGSTMISGPKTDLWLNPWDPEKKGRGKRHF